MKIFKKTLKLPLHPFFIGVYPALFLFSHNLNELTLDQIYTPITIILISVIIIWGVLNLIIANRSISAIITSLIFLFVFSYGHIINLFNLSYYNHINFYILIILGLIILFYIYIKKHIKHLPGITIYINLFFISLTLIHGLSIGSGLYARNNQTLEIAGINIKSSSKDQHNTKPDIYYIIVDSYANNSSLKQYYDYDNSEFIEYLEQQKFYVATDSYANYPYTLPSLASSLNMVYLDSLAEQMDTSSKDELPLIEMIEDNKIVSYLIDQGYKYYHFGPRQLPNEKNKHAYYNYDHAMDSPYYLSNFEVMLLSQSLLGTLIFPKDEISDKDLQNFDERYKHYLGNLNTVDKITEIASDEGPKFIFVHTLLTHVPYVFDKNGNYKPLIHEQAQSWEFNYIDQLVYTNKLLTKMIDGLLTKSANKPIIIIQSDEGPYPEDTRGETYLTFDWRSASEDHLREKMGILSAYFFPDSAGVDDLYPTITPINTFRVVLNNYFGKDIELLEDKNFVRTHRQSVYDMLEVTKKLK